MSEKIMLSGILSVVQMPYDGAENPDWEVLQREVDWVFDHGGDGVVAAMVSEVLRLTEGERDQLAQKLVATTFGRGPVVMSVGGESTAQAIRNARAAEAAGVNALMVIPPLSIGALPEEIVSYFESLLEATKLPLVVQDASGYVGKPLPIELMAGLYKRHPERIAFKPEAIPLGPNLSRLREAVGPEAVIFEGSGGIGLIDSHRRGITGTMPGAEVIWAIRALWDALEAGEEDRAREIHGLLCPLVALQQGLDGFLAVEKLLLKEQGVFESETVRGPRGYVLDPVTRSEALDLLVRLKEVCGREN